MDYYNEVLNVRRMVEEAALLGAIAADAIHGTLSDEVSEHKAWKIYGRAWMVDRTNRGLIHYTRNGANEKSTKIYSRFEIEAQKRSEKMIDDMYVAMNSKLEKK